MNRPEAPADAATFADLGLGREVLADLAALGFEKPTPIQARAIPVALSGRDLIGIAQTGTGKTAAFVLPIVERLPVDQGPRALVLSPTRELTLQTFQCARQMGKSKGFGAVALIGGEGFTEQNRELAAGRPMVVGTPGRVLDQIERRHFDPRGIEVLVLDEADRLLDMGFAEQIDAIVHRLPRKRQTLLFSATMPGGIKALARAYMHDPVEVTVGATMTAVERCKQELYVCTQREKTMLLKWLLRREDGQVLVFTRTRRGADELERELRHGGHALAVLHADRTQDERNRAMRQFRDGEVRVLIATDLASRGLDVNGIARVVNFDVPPTAEDYLHRIGRTARVDREGVASTFATLDNLSSLRSIEAQIKQRIPTVHLSREELNAFAREEADREYAHGQRHGRDPHAHVDHSHGSHGSHRSHGPAHAVRSGGRRRRSNRRG